MIDGNTAAGLGCVYAGATVGAWYPITPSTSLMDAFKGFCERYRVDPETGERNFAVLQAEDELAAVGMVLGASWNGARAFTPTSGPGISLMNEFVGLAYYAEVPCVIFDVQRVGPSTGMPTRTQQVGHHAVRLRLARRYAARAAVSGKSRGMLLHGGAGLRSGRAPADPGVRALGSRHRHERLDVPGLEMGRCLPAGSRQDPVAGGARGSGEILSLSGSRRRCDSVPHAAGDQSQGRVFHARLRPQSIWRLHRGFRRIPGRARSAEAQVRERRRSTCRSR